MTGHTEQHEAGERPRYCLTEIREELRLLDRAGGHGARAHEIFREAVKTIDAVLVEHAEDVATIERLQAQLTPPTPAPDSEAKLTPEYLAMTPLQKWDTLTLHGLLGTDEPWIADMRQTLAALPPAGGWQQEQVEEAARGIFNHWQFGRWVAGEKPVWVPHGNSDMQRLARDFAQAALAALTQPSGEHP